MPIFSPVSLHSCHAIACWVGKCFRAMIKRGIKHKACLLCLLIHCLRKDKKEIKVKFSSSVCQVQGAPIHLEILFSYICFQAYHEHHPFRSRLGYGYGYGYGQLMHEDPFAQLRHLGCWTSLANLPKPIQLEFIQ